MSKKEFEFDPEKWAPLSEGVEGVYMKTRHEKEKREKLGSAWKIWAMFLLIWISLVQLYVVSRDIYFAIKISQATRNFERDLKNLK